MKRKELKNLAEKIAKYELIIQQSTDTKEVKNAEMAIMELSSHVKSLDDIVAIDDFVQEILEKKIKKT